MAGLDLGKQIGPLPLGAWVAVVGGGLFIASRSRSSTPTEAGIVTSADPNVGIGGTPAFTSVGNSTPINGEPAINDNEQWGTAAVRVLIADGYDPNTADSAVRKYLVTDALSTQEYALIGVALRKIGPPPVPLPPATVNTPSPVGNTGDGLTSIAQTELDNLRRELQWNQQSNLDNFTIKNNEQSLAQAYINKANNVTVPPGQFNAAYYTVRPGDTLAMIAARAYNGAQDWQRIWNANRDIITDPGVLQTGWVIRIPV